MSSERNIEQREDNENQGSSGKAFFIVMSVSLAVYVLLLFLGRPGMALTSALCMATIVVAVGICWDLRTRFWFWIVIALVLALHLPLIFLVHWPHHWIPGIALAPIGIVDCMIIVGIVHFVQRYIMKELQPDDDN